MKKGRARFNRFLIVCQFFYVLLKGEQMLVKNYTKTHKKCRVTFKCPNHEQASTAELACS
ncbi:MAG: hypothetical protein D3908_02525 [Candidatus Electrothrix sp. AUS4]|nr:hypothetical protein [Candidatus Electrothrix sp. AUS4]